MKTQPVTLFFDINETLLDMQPVKTSVAKVLNDTPELVPLWFTTMLQYALVSTVNNQFHDFTSIGTAAIQMVAQKNNIEISDNKAREALKPMLYLDPYADVVPGISKLKNAGFTLIALTNSSRFAMESQLRHANLNAYFDNSLSVEDIKMYKPHQHVYRWAAYQMDTQVEDCMMVAAHGWDVAGANWAGMQSAFISRPGQVTYPLAPTPELVVPDLIQLAEKLGI